jgi:phage-related protein
LFTLRKLGVVFFRTASGREPVREWLRSLHKEERKILGEDIARVQYEWPLGKPHVDHLRGPVWEVRSNLVNRAARVLFATLRDEMVLLHGFIKKTRTTPGEQIEIAERRWAEWQEDEDE